MNILVIDGNSLINRAFYGVRLLSNKKGQYTNAIYGFMNMYMSLKSECNPDGTVVAFDLKAPTFRHKMYAEYKAGRHAMPDELREQFPVIKELLKYLGCHVVEVEGWEADDILGTIAAQATGEDKCFIATGDRDSLQLVSKNANVLLATTKMGNVLYDEDKLMEEYGVSPAGMIEIKALQGDSSDNIPGVAGVGPKTAMTLVQKFGNIDNLYENLDDKSISAKLREKLENGKDSAYMSRILGTIKCEAPISKNLEDYKYNPMDIEKTEKLLSELEMYKMIDKLGLKIVETESDKPKEAVELIIDSKSADEMMSLIDNMDELYVYLNIEKGEIVSLNFLNENTVYEVSSIDFVFNNLIENVLSSDKKKIVSDSKTLYKLSLENDVGFNGEIFDVMLGGYVLNPSLKEYTPEYMAKSFNINIPDNEDKNAVNTYLLKSVADYISEKITGTAQADLFYNIEMPLAEVLASMEYEGFLVDEQGLVDYGEYLGNRVNELTREIFEAAGETFNLNSPKQLGEILFEKLGLPSKKKTKTGYSTNAEVLESLTYAHPIVPLILQYRTFAKLKSTYCEGLLKVIDDDGRIRSTFNQTEARTGRLSSSDPNLQNIPVRTPEGREFRKFFVAKPNCVLVDADYSQIELRVLAHMADDEKMIDAFNAEQDFHTITASNVFNIPENLITPLMRSRAKAVNFGVVYGIGAFSLAKDIGVSRKEADKYIKDYLELYSGVNKFMENSINSAKENGYAETMFGRRRYLPELNDSKAMVRNFGERVAMNMPVQGTAADIIKIAMVKVFDRLKKENMKSKLIMTVHDELIVEAPVEEKESAEKIVTEEMENACKMRVKLVSEAGVGETWYLAKG